MKRLLKKKIYIASFFPVTHRSLSFLGHLWYFLCVHWVGKEATWKLRPKPANEPEWFLPKAEIFPGSVEFPAQILFSKRIAEFFQKFTTSIKSLKVCLFPSSFWNQTSPSQTTGNLEELNKLLSSSISEKGFFYMQFERVRLLFHACKYPNSS